MASRKPTTKAGKKAKMKTAMSDFKAGKMHSGSKSGPKVTDPKQAIAIGLKQSGQDKKKSSPSSGKTSSARRKKLKDVTF